MTRPSDCISCGAPIRQHPQAPPRLYCGPKCKDRHYRRQRQAEAPKIPPPPCPVCGGDMPATSPRGGNPRRTCSRKCSRRATYLRERGGKWTKPRTRCEWCSQPMPAGIASKRFCGDTCCRRSRRARKAKPDLSKFQPDEAAAIAAAIAAGKVTRIEQGEWPDPDREGMRQWRKRRAA